MGTGPALPAQPLADASAAKCGHETQSETRALTVLTRYVALHSGFPWSCTHELAALQIDVVPYTLNPTIHFPPREIPLATRLDRPAEMNQDLKHVFMSPRHLPAALPA
jgi:hypothetical protein